MHSQLSCRAKILESTRVSKITEVAMQGQSAPASLIHSSKTMKDETLKGLGQSTCGSNTTVARMPSQCETTGQDLHEVGKVAGKAHQSGCRTHVHGFAANERRFSLLSSCSIRLTARETTRRPLVSKQPRGGISGPVVTGPKHAKRHGPNRSLFYLPSSVLGCLTDCPSRWKTCPVLAESPLLRQVEVLKPAW